MRTDYLLAYYQSKLERLNKLIARSMHRGRIKNAELQQATANIYQETIDILKVAKHNEKVPD